MRDARRKLAILLILAGAAVPLAFVSVAYACGILATLHFNNSSASPGGKVSGFGGNYNAAPKASLVVLHFNGRTGSVLWTGHPDLNGTILPSFNAPKVRPGYYLIDATQTTPTGAAAPGTPGRAVLRIGHPAKHKHASGAAAAWPAAPPQSGVYSTSSGSNTTVFASTGGLLVALLSGSLLAGGVFLLLGDRRRGRSSAPAV